MRRTLIILAASAIVPAALAAPPAPAGPQDSKSWLESQGLEAAASKEFQEFEAIVARVKGAKDAQSAQERVVVFAKGKLAWQSNPKELVEPAQKFALHSLGRDLDGERPAAAALLGLLGRGALLHHALRLQAQAPGEAARGLPRQERGRHRLHRPAGTQDADHDLGRRLERHRVRAVLQLLLPAGGPGGGPKGQFQFAGDLMHSRLPGMPPPVCASPPPPPTPGSRSAAAKFAGASARPAPPRSRRGCRRSSRAAPPTSSSGRTTSRTACSRPSPRR